ncbi:MAG: C40 family peptidase [Treponema sp.]|nr:C40 family peptidase [Treponema sp.]
MPPSWVAHYIGIPFVSGGRDHTGCDCYGLVRLVLLKQFGYKLPLLSLAYNNACDTTEIEPLMQNQLPLLCGNRIQQPEPGAVIVVRYAGRTAHVGIFTDDEFILHTLNRIGAHCISRQHRSVRGAMEGIYRVSQAYLTVQPS